MMILIIMETLLILHVIANLEIQIVVFEISWQIGAEKYYHIKINIDIILGI